ncbi:hypothetical protein ACJX0J_037739, partial [Zea mays]
CTNRFLWHAGFPLYIYMDIMEDQLHYFYRMLSTEKSKSNRGQIEINKCSQKFTFDYRFKKIHILIHFYSTELEDQTGGSEYQTQTYHK